MAFHGWLGLRLHFGAMTVSGSHSSLLIPSSHSCRFSVSLMPVTYAPVLLNGGLFRSCAQLNHAARAASSGFRDMAGINGTGERPGSRLHRKRQGTSSHFTLIAQLRHAVDPQKYSGGPGTKRFIPIDELRPVCRADIREIMQRVWTICTCDVTPATAVRGFRSCFRLPPSPFLP